MASCYENTRLDASQKLRNDHELFLEAYERPTQIYRFLKAKHSFEPLFLQRNLSYMKNRRVRSKRNGICLQKLVETTKEDFPKEINSDCHLTLSFDSVTKENNFPVMKEDSSCSSSSSEESESDEESHPDGSLMEVEVVLYRFKHPTPEAVITSTPTSLSCVSTSLGKCTVPYHPSNSVSNKTSSSCISIPASVLSWKETSGVLGTHMLAIRVTPFTKQTKKLAENNKKRKRNVTFSNTVESLPFIANNKITGQSNGIVTSSLEHNSLSNGVVGRPASKKTRKVSNKPSEKVCNGDTQSNYGTELLKRLHGKAPGGKKFPTLNNQADDQLVVSVSRNLVASTKSRKRKTRFESLNDSHYHDSQTDSDTASTNGSNDNSSDSNHLHSRKRTINNCSLSNEADLNSPDQPVTKKSCLSSEEPIDHTSPSHQSIPPTFKPQQQPKIYTAELVAFDSRQECLIVNGEYELLLQCCSPIDTKQSKHTAGDIYVLPSLNQDTILSMDQSSISQLPHKNNTMTLKFNAKWTPSLPKPRTSDMMETAYDILKLRKSYNRNSQTDKSTTKHKDCITTQQATEDPISSTPDQVNSTLFNFLYNNDTLQQTQLKENCVCPWCSLDCKELYCLLKHMTLCHPRFRFTYNVSDKDAPSIDVRLNKHYNTKVSSTDPVDVIGRDAVKVRRQPTKLKPTTSVLVTRCADYKTCSLKEFTNRQQLPAIELTRTFYHPQSCLPMLPHEIGSEGDNSCEWLKTTSMKMVDEFIDVNYGEKQFMKVWNLYMIKQRAIADKQMLQICLKFAREKLAELKEKNIIHNFISHIMYMCDIGLVPSSIIKEIYRIISEHSTVT